MSVSTAAVLTRALTKRYGARLAVGPIDLEVEAGDFVALLGANGAGKSTLLRLLASLARPSGGEAWVFGRRVERGPGSSAARRAVGYVGHPLLAYRALSVRQNLEFFGRLYGLDGVAARVREMLEHFGLGARTEDSVGSLSRGLQQKVSLARALLHEPRLLLLDEPFGGLDAGGARALSAALKQAHSAGCSVILATHDLSHASGLAAGVAVLERGRLAHFGRAPQGAAGWEAVVRGAAGSAGA